jgi:Ricin-type beta-trefoil lectin domain-like
LINVYSGLALSSPYPRTQAGIQLEQYTYLGSSNQKWAFDEVNPLVSGATYKVTARHSNKALEIPGTNAPNGTAARQWSWFGSMNQRWITTWLGSGQQSISNASSNRVLEVGGLSNNNGVIIQQWSWVGHNWQKWTLEAVDHDAGGFWYQIVNVGSGKVVSVNDTSLYDGAGIQQWTKWGLSNQQWRFNQ